MKVSLAAQTLSSSVADAINFLNNGLQLQQFKDSESTVEFIRMVDRLFDILNSRSPVAKGFKQPLRLSTQGRWLSVLQNTAQYLLSLKSVDGQSMMQHRRKTFVIGFVTTIKSTIDLAMILMNADVHPFKYFLTYKFSQDHVELLFSCIRSRGGWNNNPNSLQLKYAPRKMLLKNSITASNSANCQVFEQNTIIPALPTNQHNSPLQENLINPHDAQMEEEVNSMMINLQRKSHTEFIKNVLFYIAGFVVSRLVKKISCQSCKNCLIGSLSHSDHPYYDGYNKSHGAAAFTAFVNNGGLKIPSSSVYKIVEYAEHVFKFYVCKDKFDKISISSKLKQKMIMEVINHFWEDSRTSEGLFEGHPQGLNEPVFEEDHERWLTKCVADKFFTLRLFTYGKNYCQKVIQAGQASRRHELTKLVLFKNQ